MEAGRSLNNRTSRPNHAAAGGRRLVCLLGFVIAVGPVSVDMYLPAFTQIARELGNAVPAYTLASYFAGFAVGQLVQGWLSDRFGRRRSLAAGLLLYTAASLGCAACSSGLSFCCWRALAAFGAAASIVVPRAMIRDVADGRTAGGLISSVLQIMSIAPIVAPIAGGLVLARAGWRWIFVLAAVYGTACLMLLVRYLPETLPVHQRQHAGPVAAMRLYSAILADPEFLRYAAIGSCGMAALFAYLAGAPAVFMQRDGINASLFAVLLASLGAAMILFFNFNGRIVRRHGVISALRLGTVIWLAASLALGISALAGNTRLAVVYLCLLVFSLGYSLIPGNAQVAALSRHAAHAASATALLSTIQYCAGALAGGLTGLVAEGTLRIMAAIMFGCGAAAAAIAHRAFGRQRGGTDSAEQST